MFVFPIKGLKYWEPELAVCFENSLSDWMVVCIFKVPVNYG